ncbi:MAG: galactokinase [Candidatus Hodarchaeota archaeon]
MEVLVTHAPGRVNLIGEHTDHQGGLVMPVCINLQITAWASPREDQKFVVHSETLNDTDCFDSSTITKSTGWKNYVRGTVRAFCENSGNLNGANIWITSTIPTGGGLSSSAALEMAILSTLEAIEGKKLSDEEAIHLCWKTETNFVGVSCGIMDQFIIRKGKKNYALRIDCRDLTYEFVKMPTNAEILVIDTNFPRQLTFAPYNQRIQELAIAKQQLQSAGCQIQDLGEISPEMLAKYASHLTSPYRQRLEHVVSENERVRRFERNLIQNDLENVGKLLFQSHASLRDYFKASWERADALVTLSQSLEGVYGARMVGAGWGGSVMMLIEASKSQEIKKRLTHWFLGKYGEQPLVHILYTTDGVSCRPVSIPAEPARIQDFLTGVRN